VQAAGIAHARDLRLVDIVHMQAHAIDAELCGEPFAAHTRADDAPDVALPAHVVSVSLSIPPDLIG
jgi:hypothetical protein